MRIEELNDLGNGGVGLVHGSLEFAVGLEFGVGSAAEQVVGQWTAQTLMEEDEDDRDLGAFVGEAVGVTRAVALDQRVGAQFAQVVAELVQGVSLSGQPEAREDHLMKGHTAALLIQHKRYGHPGNARRAFRQLPRYFLRCAGQVVTGRYPRPVTTLLAEFRGWLEGVLFALRLRSGA